MHSKGMYNKMVLYIEACESGSMFDGILATDLNIYAVTAANPTESSWGTYCSPNDVVNGRSVGSCLGDLFSVVWMEDSETADMSMETLMEQFTKVRNLTTKSHVMEYGTVSFKSDPIGDYQSGSSALPITLTNVSDVAAAAAVRLASAVDSRDVLLHLLYNKYLSAPAGLRASAETDLRAELDSRNRWDQLFDAMEKAVRGPRMLRMRDGRVKHWECLRTSLSAIEFKCGRLSDYALKHVRRVVEMCDMEGGYAGRIVEQLATLC